MPQDDRPIPQTGTLGEGDAAAAICGHHLLRFSNVDALDAFHVFVQEHLARLSVAVITEARAAAIEDVGRLLQKRKEQWGDEHNRKERCSLTVQNELGASIAAVRALATQPAQSGK